MLTGYELGRHAELGRAENPVWVREIIEEAKILEAAISGVEAVPFRVFRTLWIAASSSIV